MKTTIDLPDDVLSKAKIVAASRGMTLRELVLRASDSSPIRLLRKRGSRGRRSYAIFSKTCGEQHRTDGSFDSEKVQSDEVFRF